MNNRVKQFKNRAAGFELFRIFACFGIVWFHLGLPGRIIGYSGLPYFMILTVYFLVSNKQEKTLKYIFSRIMLPWLFWSFIYALFIYTKAYLFNENPNDKFFLWMIATGSAIHLWYLPFSFMITILLLKFKKRIIIQGNPLLWSVLCSVATIISSIFMNKINHIIPLKQYVFITPSVFIGIYFSKALKQPISDLLFKNVITDLKLPEITEINLPLNLYIK